MRMVITLSILIGNVLGISAGEGIPAEVQPGINIYSPNGSQTTYLRDNDGNLLRTWQSNYAPGLGLYLLPNGNLLRPGNTNSPFFAAGGAGGIVEEFDRDNNLVWTFEYDNDQHRLHHDIQPMPSGNILMVAWELKTEAECIAAGRNPAALPAGELWVFHIIEVEPTRPVGGNIVWEWHLWDHLVQDFDPTKDNFGVIADSPQLVDINYPGSRPGSADWNHVNGIHYNPELDQIVASINGFSELWIIDHSTTTEEAASHSGGLRGKGGDLLYRWGNPEVYGRGTPGDRKLFGQHDTRWIEDGLVGAGNILLFNNGLGRPEGDISTVDELTPPMDGQGNYILQPGAAYGPEELTWQYMAPVPTDFFSSIVSGAQRLENGNTLICEGTSGYFFEVTQDLELVWDYQTNPIVFRVNRYREDHLLLGALPQWPEQETVATLMSAL